MKTEHEAWFEIARQVAFNDHDYICNLVHLLRVQGWISGSTEQDMMNRVLTRRPKDSGGDSYAWSFPGGPEEQRRRRFQWAMEQFWETQGGGSEHDPV